MIYERKMKVTQELLDDAEVNEEHIFRQLCQKIIGDIPIHELRGLFIFKKLDPFSNENEDKLADIFTPQHIKEEIIQLRNMQLLEYEVSLNIDEKLHICTVKGAGSIK